MIYGNGKVIHDNESTENLGLEVGTAPRVRVKRRDDGFYRVKIEDKELGNNVFVFVKKTRVKVRVASEFVCNEALILRVRSESAEHNRVPPFLSVGNP
jgi:hypothetical protein